MVAVEHKVYAFKYYQGIPAALHSKFAAEPLLPEFLMKPYAALLGYVALHAGIGVLFLVSNFLRLGAGFIAPRRVLDLRLTRLWLDYTLVTGVIAMGLVLALPALVTMLGARP